MIDDCLMRCVYCNNVNRLGDYKQSTYNKIILLKCPKCGKKMQVKGIYTEKTNL